MAQFAKFGKVWQHCFCFLFSQLVPCFARADLADLADRDGGTEGRREARQVTSTTTTENRRLPQPVCCAWRSRNNGVLRVSHLLLDATRVSRRCTTPLLLCSHSFVERQNWLNVQPIHYSVFSKIERAGRFGSGGRATPRSTLARPTPLLGGFTKKHPSPTSLRLPSSPICIVILDN